MPDLAPNAELLRSLGRLVRGLSALFWGLPITLIVCFHTAKADSLRSFGIVPPLVTTGLLAFGLWQLGDFQKQERVWRVALDRARVLSLINFGLSPFLYWWNRVPNSTFFLVAVLVMGLTALAFLGSLNLVLRRLGAMLPDEALRQETKQFTIINLVLLLAIFVLAALNIAIQFHPLPLWLNQPLPVWLDTVVAVVERGSFWFLILAVLLPLAMTMALIWKTKEVILENVFGTTR